MWEHQAAAPQMRNVVSLRLDMASPFRRRLPEPEYSPSDRGAESLPAHGCHPQADYSLPMTF